MKRFAVFIFGMFICGVAFADTETINWYVDNSVYDTTTCQTGGDITLLAAPDKRGHRFTGWEAALYDFSTLDYTINGTSYTRNETARTWTVTFPYGTVSGRALCSITYGTYAVSGSPDESTSGDTKYCWCNATEYKSINSAILYKPTSSIWFLVHTFSIASSCATACAQNCGYYMLDSVQMRETAFGITQ